MTVRHFMLEGRYVRLLSRRSCWSGPVAYHPPTRERVGLPELELSGEDAGPPPSPLGPDAG